MCAAFVDPDLVCRDEDTLGIFAATLNSGHTLVVKHHIVRFTDTALLAGGGGFGGGAPTVAFWVRAGRLTGWKAVGEAAVGGALQSDIGTVAGAILNVLAVSPRGTLEILASNDPFHAVTALGTASGSPALACRDETTLGMLAATLNSEHTLVVAQHIARLTHAALFAVRVGIGADALTVAVGVRAGRMTGGKAVCELAVGWALQRDFDTVTAAIIAVLAVCPWGTLEIPAPHASFHAGTALGTVFGYPSLACRDEDTLSIFAATMRSEHTLVVKQHIVRLADAALPAGGGDFVARALTAAVWIQAGRWTGGKAVCIVTVSWTLQRAEAAVPPDRWLEPLVLAGIFKGLQRITKSTEELSEFTEAVHTLQQEGLDGYPGGTMGPGRTLKGSLAVCLGFLKVNGPAFSIHDLLLFHLEVLPFDFLAIWVHALIFPAIHELLLILC